MKAKLSNATSNFWGSTQEQILEALKTKYELAFKTLSGLRMELKQSQKEVQEVKYDKSFISLEAHLLEDKIHNAMREFKNAVREWNGMRRRVLAQVR